MKLRDQKLGAIIATIEDADSECFAGVVAYLGVAMNLALFIKLLNRKLKKITRRSHTYVTLIALAQSIVDDSVAAAETDGEVFKRISTDQDCDGYIEEITTKQISYLTNISTIKAFLSMLIQETKGALKPDMQMILSALTTSKESLLSIVKYEVEKIKDEMLKAMLQGEITKL